MKSSNTISEHFSNTNRLKSNSYLRMTHLNYHSYDPTGVPYPQSRDNPAEDFNR